MMQPMIPQLITNLETIDLGFQKKRRGNTLCLTVEVYLSKESSNIMKPIYFICVSTIARNICIGTFLE